MEKDFISTILMRAEVVVVERVFLCSFELCGQSQEKNGRIISEALQAILSLVSIYW